MKISGSVTIGVTTSGDTVNGVIAALNVSDALGKISTMYFTDLGGYELRLDPIDGISFLKRNADGSIEDGWWIQTDGMYFYENGETHEVLTKRI